MPVALYTYSQVIVWETAPGGTLRTLRGGTVTVRHGDTDAVLFTVVADEHGQVDFVTTDVPTVTLESPSGLRRRVTSQDAVEAAATFVVSEDAGVAGLVASTTSATRAQLDGLYEPRLSTLRAAAGDQTAALNSFFAAASPLGVKQLIGDFSVSGAVTVPAGVYVDASAAKITQTAANVVTLTLGSGATLYGGTLVGLGTDYVAGGSPVAMGVDTAVGATGVRISQALLKNFSGAAIRLRGVSDAMVTGVTIVGVGSPTITSGDGSPCFGILASDGAASGITISGCDISETCQGIIMDALATHVTISDVRVHDIRGQHGLYLQNGTGLTVTNVDVRGVPLIGCKVQLSSTTAADSLATSITNITADTCGDTALVLVNTATDLSTTTKLRGVTIANVAATSCFRGLYLGSVWGGTVSGVSVVSSTSDAVTLIDCQDLVLTGVSVAGCGRVGIRLTSSTGSANARVAFHATSIRNPAAANVGNTQYGIYVAEGTRVTFDGLDISATNGFLVYGLFFAGGDQASLVLRNADLSGDTGTSIRLLAGPVAVREWANVRVSGSVLNYPTALVTRHGSRGLGTVYSSNAVPASGTYRVGDECINNIPTAGSPKSWVCTAAGSPGTWVSTGNL